MKSTMLLTVLFTALTAFSNQAQASNNLGLSQESEDHLTISTVRVEDVTSSYPEYTMQDYYNSISPSPLQQNPAAEQNIIAQLEAADVIVDKIINIGTKIWKIVEAGKPVVNYQSQAANALPQKTLRWDQLQNYARPTSKVMSVSYENLFGMEVVKFTYRVVMLYGGNVGGVGRYIGYAKVEPMEMDTAWGYNIDAKAQVDSTFNLGSSKNPVAGMILNIGWTVKTVLKSSTSTHTYTLDGNGRISEPSEQ